MIAPEFTKRQADVLEGSGESQYNVSQEILAGIRGMQLDYSGLDDESLLRLIAFAKTAALAEFYDRYSRLVYSLAMFILNDGESAEEVTQDVFMRIWEKAETYRSEQAKVSTWLTSITRNRAIDILRRQRARPEGHRVGLGEEAFEAMVAADLPEPEEAVVEILQARKVRVAISTLPQDQRRALALAYFGGYSHTEIAAVLGEPLGTVKTRIRMAMQKLRSMLEEDSLEI
jgi:RNA polymerase sigma-70 factor (ECF subfamily)